MELFEKQIFFIIKAITVLSISYTKLLNTKLFYILNRKTKQIPILNKYINILIPTSLNVDMWPKLRFVQKLPSAWVLSAYWRNMRISKGFRRYSLLFTLYPYLDTLRFARMVVVVLSDVIGVLLNSCHNLLFFLYLFILNL